MVALIRTFRSHTPRTFSTIGRHLPARAGWRRVMSAGAQTVVGFSQPGRVFAQVPETPPWKAYGAIAAARFQGTWNVVRWVDRIRTGPCDGAFCLLVAVRRREHPRFARFRIQDSSSP